MNNPTTFKYKVVLTFLICTLIIVSFTSVVSAQVSVVRAETSASQPKAGDTLTVNIKISNAENLFGVDVTLNWNPSVLKLVSAIPQLGVESHLGGVLHESSSFPIEVLDNNASQSSAMYHLLATSIGSSTPGFTGSGTIATVTFTVTALGSTGLALNDVELSIKGSSDVVNPSTSVDSVNPIVPEFSTITIIVLFLFIATASIAITTKLLKNRRNLTIKTATKL